MRKLRWWLAGAALVVLIAAGTALAWHARWKSTAISDVTLPADLTLRAQAGDSWLMGGVSGVSVWVTGEINGEAELFAGSSEGQRLSGRVDWRVYRDKFEPVCMVHYRPKSVTAGHLVVHYKFH